MPKFKKCPRCDINYIPLEKEYCEICEAEMRGMSFPEISDDEEGELCPKCGVNYLNEGEKICESCLQEIEKSKSVASSEFEWDGTEPEEEDNNVDEEDIIMPESVSLEALQEEEDWDGEDEKFDDEENFDEEETLSDELEDLDNLDDLDDLDEEDEEDEE